MTIILLEGSAGGQNYREIALSGNYNQADNVFVHDLAPGEVVLKEMEVAMGAPRATCFELLLIIMTLGLYLLLACCRPGRLFNHRQKLVVTSHGRILTWRSDIEGQHCCNKSQYHSHTSISSFSIRKLCHIERQFLRAVTCDCLPRSIRCECCCPEIDTCRLRLFFDDYPEDVATEASSLIAVPNTIIMQKLTTSGLYNWAFGFARKIFAQPPTVVEVRSIVDAVVQLIRGILDNSLLPIAQSIARMIFKVRANIQVLISGNPGLDTAHFLEISSFPGDKLHKQGSAWAELLELERIIMMLKYQDLQDHLKGDVQRNGMWREAEGSMHIVEDKVVVVNRRLLSLAETEEVLDAFPITYAWSLGDILITIATFGIGYFIWVKPKLAFRGALILTRKRLFEVYVDSSGHTQDPQDQGNEKSLRVSVRQWFFGRLSQGMIEYNNNAMYGHIKTKYGGLCVIPIVNQNACYTYFYGLSEENREKISSFLLNFSRTAEAPLLQYGGQQFPNENYTAKLSKFMDAEKPLMVLNSEFPRECCLSCMRVLSLGCKPVVPYQEIVVTTHRLWASAHPENDPWVLADCCRSRFWVLYWKPLVDIKGFKVNGDGWFQETSLTQLCKCCCFPLDSNVRVEIATTKSYPISINRLRRGVKHGGIADPQIRDFRQLMAVVEQAGNQAKRVPVVMPAAH
jgi:hypothetical protein